MKIKETPTNYRVYYKSMKDVYTQLREEAVSAREDLYSTVNNLWKSVNSNLDLYKEKFNINLEEYEEYISNKYISGTFLKIAKGLFINRKNNYTIVSDLFDLYNLATKQKSINELDNDINLYDRILSLTLSQYNELLRVFYTEVHKHMIIKGEGYVFEDCIGWTCINRCHIDKQAPHINYAATKKRKAELQAQGKRIYKKEEAEWCEKNGIEYDAVDARVFMKNEYCYEIPLIGCKLPNGRQYKLEISDYRGRSIRGITNDTLAFNADGNLEYICNLPLDIRAKLNICNSIDKTLYTNFIRNENQKPINIAKAGRKD